MATKFQTAIVWLRRDLRLSDNPALHHASRSAEQIIPVYITSTWKSSHSWTGPNRQAFLAGSLDSLDKNLKSVGSRLFVRCGDAATQLEELARETNADAIFFNRDVDPYGVEKENQVARSLEALGLAVSSYQDVVLHGKEEVLTGSDTPYRVFTPYSKNWLSLEKPAPLPRPRKLTSPANLASGSLPDLDHWSLSQPTASIIEPGEKAARKRMANAVGSIVPDYAKRRNTPAGQTTSRLGQDLRFGLISIRELFAKLTAAKNESRSPDTRKGIDTFISELAWREFYMAVLGHFPEVLEHEFNPDWRGLPWDDDREKLERWADGETGFPIVDAGMRQLRETGFMHNRVRMIVSMFLTKDLHIHWMRGESHFMQHLVDGEIASNNGGWQWSAGTGADAAPYFRIQNPWSQTKSYDPAGEYIKTWIPELKDTDPKQFLAPPTSGSIAKSYPEPMVDHSEERLRTLEIFKKHRASNGP